jgi:predicted kinase
VNKSELYILCGLPFAGKSILAKELVKRFGFVYIAIDQINTSFGVGLLGTPISPEAWEKTYTEAYKQLGDALDSGQSVIFEGANFTKELRDRIRTISDVRGVTSRVIFVDISVSEAQRRLLNNRVTQKRYDIRDDNFAYAVTYFEPPTENEGVIHYYQSQPLDEWILQNFKRTNL